MNNFCVRDLSANNFMIHIEEIFNEFGPNGPAGQDLAVSTADDGGTEMLFKKRERMY